MKRFPKILDSHFILRILKNDVSPEEKEYFNSWLEESDENKEEFGSIALIWDKAGKSKTPNPPDPQWQWEKIQFEIWESTPSGEAIDQKSVAESQPSKNIFSRPDRMNLNISYLPSGIPTKRRIRTPLRGKKNYLGKSNLFYLTLRVAAALFISLGIYILFSQTKIHIEPQQKQTNNTYNFITKKGERATIPLSDGSIIFMNSDSRLIYPQFFSDSIRLVELLGEAFFSVKSNANQPFIVKTGNSFTEVVGTEFNIRFRDNRLNVIVTKGKISLYNGDHQERISVNKGELITYDNSSGFSRPRKVDIKSYIAWRENQLAFIKSPFTEVLNEIERQFNVNITIKNLGSKNKTLTGFFDADSLDEVLSKIALAMDVHIKRDGDKIIVY